MLSKVTLFPTWFSIRLFGHFINPDGLRNQVGDGGHAGLQWGFYSLLERFLTYGPVREKCVETPYIDRGITVRTLILDISSAEPNLPFPEWQVDYGRWRARHYGRGYSYAKRHQPDLADEMDLMEYA
ncbi:hypothetical protein BJX99DRAFT_258679 [Aspergillus californicus]